MHAAAEGAVEPLANALALLDAARDLGATVVDRMPVTAIEERHGQVIGVRTADHVLTADQVVIAAGAGSAALAGTVTLCEPPPAIDNPANLLVVTAPQDRLLRGLLLGPRLHMRQTAEGHLVAASAIDERDPEIAAQAILEAMRATFRSKPSLSLASHAIARRPIPRGGLPIVRYLDSPAGLYIATTHSGITLAPAIGRFVAEEIIHGRRAPLLEVHAGGNGV